MGSAVGAREGVGLGEELATPWFDASGVTLGSDTEQAPSRAEATSSVARRLALIMDSGCGMRHRP